MVSKMSWQMSRHDVTFLLIPRFPGKCRDMSSTLLRPKCRQMSKILSRQLCQGQAAPAHRAVCRPVQAPQTYRFTGTGTGTGTGSGTGTGTEGDTSEVCERGTRQEHATPCALGVRVCATGMATGTCRSTFTVFNLER